MTEKENMLAGRLYRASDPVLVEERRQARVLVEAFNRSDPSDAEGRRAVLMRLLGSFGEGSFIEPTFRCDYGYNVHVGERFFANFDCIFLDVVPIHIGDDVLFGPAVQLLAATHPLDPDERASGLELGAPITIGSKVWIGGGAMVCPGVTIGDGTTIGAGSVVTRDIPPRVLAAGNPCRLIREL